MRRRAQPGDHAVDRGALGCPVVDEGKRQRQPVGRLPDRDHLVAGVNECTPGALGERLVAQPRECLGRAEPCRAAADEQDARQGVMRHGSE